jgi:hypothetical protein
MKVVSVTGRTIVVDMTWDDGLVKNGIPVHNAPVESFDQCYQFLTSYLSGIYEQVRAAADAYALANPTPDPRVLSAVGHTFDNTGAVVS